MNYFECEIENRTTAVRVIYDGVRNAVPIRIGKGEKVTAILADHVIDLMARRREAEGEESEIGIRKLRPVTSKEALAGAAAGGPTFSHPLKASTHAVGAHAEAQPPEPKPDDDDGNDEPDDAAHQAPPRPRRARPARHAAT